MFTFKPLVGAVLMAIAASAHAASERPHRRDQDAAYDARRAGTIRPLRELERRVLPRMGGAAYLGPEFDPGSSTYRMKFMRSGAVIWVDVDGRTGEILGQSGN